MQMKQRKYNAKRPYGNTTPASQIYSGIEKQTNIHTAYSISLNPSPAFHFQPVEKSRERRKTKALQQLGNKTLAPTYFRNYSPNQPQLKTTAAA